MHRRTSSQRHLSQSGMPRPTGPSYFHPLGSLGQTTSTDSSIFVNIIEHFHPRKTRQRTTVLCLVTLIIITSYICLVSPPLFSPGAGLHRPNLAHAEDTWRKLAAKLPSHPPGFLPTHPPTEISLSPEQELGAVTAFMAALPQNVIPTDIDPTQPIDPQLVLDFDTRGPQAEAEVTDIIEEVWRRNPMVLFSKVGHLSALPCFASPYGRGFIVQCANYVPLWQSPSAVSRELKSMLQDMNLKPGPTIFDINQRGQYLRLPSLQRPH
jgi:hypothetical protein